MSLRNISGHFRGISGTCGRASGTGSPRRAGPRRHTRAIRGRRRAGDAQDAVVGARRKAEARERLLEQPRRAAVEGAEAPDEARRHLGITGEPEGREALELAAPGGDDALAHGGGIVPFAFAGEIVVLDRRDRDVQVDAVEQGARDARPVVLDLRGRAGALARGVAVKAARAGVRCLFAV